MRFSLCIPNFNYAHYLGDTIRTVLSQEEPDFEIIVSDNASTDRSVDVVKTFDDKRIRLHVNACNIGFGGNLERVTRLAMGDLMIFLPSDDQLRPRALATYRLLYESLGSDSAGAVVTSSCELIDGQGRKVSEVRPDPGYWKQDDLDSELSKRIGCPVYQVPANEMLRRCLHGMKNPFPTVATCFPRALHDAVDGYWGGRLYSPDKWFLWRLLGVATSACFVDRNLFGYRWHEINQEHLQEKAGSLKYLVDEYVATIELPNEVLQKAALTRVDLERSYMKNDIGHHGLATLARGNRHRARRILDFGRATYPLHVRKVSTTRTLSWLLRLGPLGQKIAAHFYKRHLAKVAEESVRTHGVPVTVTAAP